MTRLRPPPEVATEGAEAILRQAAASVGLDIKRLLELASDNKILALPPADDIAQQYTLEDLGKRLWSSMQTVSRPERVEWFAKLTKPQKASIVVILRNRGFSTETIAREFEISPRTVTMMFNKYCDEMGAQVVGLRLNVIAGQMVLAAERAQQMAIEDGDGKGYWSIEERKIKTLQSLGIVDRAIQKIEHTHKFDDQQKAEIEAMLKLEEKKRQRGEELKLIEATVLDEVPEVEEYDV